MTIPADSAGNPSYALAVGAITLGGLGLRWLRDYIWPAVEVTTRHPRPFPRIVRAGRNQAHRKWR
jgi:hypothetical protein